MQAVKLSNLADRVPSAAAIEIKNVSKRFDSARANVIALDGFSLDVYPQEFVSIIGPSGCGKSTLLGLIAELDSATSGSITINGKPPSHARLARKVGLVFQDAVLLPWRTVAENAALPFEVMKVPTEKAREQIAQVLKLVKLDGFENSFPHELSGGMRQRLGIARALSFDPQILLMDEPFGALDAITRDKMTIELLSIWEQRKKTVLFITHSINEAVFLSDRVVVMTPRPGRIRTVIKNDLPRPRTLSMRDEPAFAAMSRQLRELLEQE
jgi:NitT/TauT family transport system ATP-binding protein